MIVANQTSFDIYFGPLHLAAGVGSGSGLSAPSSGSNCNPAYVYPAISGDTSNTDKPAYLVVNYIIKT